MKGKFLRLLSSLLSRATQVKAGKFLKDSLLPPPMPKPFEPGDRVYDLIAFTNHGRIRIGTLRTKEMWSSGNWIPETWHWEVGWDEGGITMKEPDDLAYVDEAMAARLLAR